jgi:hypothetical protein
VSDTGRETSDEVVLFVPTLLSLGTCKRKRAKIQEVAPTHLSGSNFVRPIASVSDSGARKPERLFSFRLDAVDGTFSGHVRSNRSCDATHFFCDNGLMIPPFRPEEKLRFVWRALQNVGKNRRWEFLVGCCTTELRQSEEKLYVFNLHDLALYYKYLTTM